MKKWDIQYWINGQGKNLIEQWFNQLTEDQFKSVAKEVIMLEHAGNQLKLPHSRDCLNLESANMDTAYIMLLLAKG